jgi:hypothetical protein
MRFNRYLIGLAGAALAFAAVPASAVITITNSGYSYGPDSQITSGGIRFGLGPNDTTSGPAGQFTSQGYDTVPTNPVSFLSFCIDVTKPFRNTMEFTVEPIGNVFGDATRRNRIAAMLINGDQKIRAATTTEAARLTAAAVGVGLWEIIYEDTGTGYSVNDGAGTFSLFGDFVYAYPGLVDLADEYLANVQTGVWTGDESRVATLVSVNGDYQNQVFLLPAVPEPATWAQLILGFGVVGGAMRWRRKRKAAVATA